MAATLKPSRAERKPLFAAQPPAPPPDHDLALDQPIVYLDGIEVSTRWIPPDLLSDLSRVHGPVKVKPVRDRTGHLRRQRLIIPRPTPAVLYVLRAFMAEHRRATICRADLASDWLRANQAEADATAEHIRRHLLLRWRRPGLMRSVGQTTYWVDLHAARSVALYPDRPSRTTAVPSPCAHLDLRFQGVRAVRRAGLGTVDELLTRDLLAILNQAVGFVPFDADAVRARILRQAMADAREAYGTGSTRKTFPALAERQLERMPFVILHMIQTLGLDTAQGYRDFHNITYPKPVPLARA